MDYKKEYQRYLKCIDKNCKDAFEDYKALVKQKLDQGKKISDLFTDEEVKEKLRIFADQRDEHCADPYEKYQDALKKSFQKATADYNAALNKKKTQKKSKKSKTKKSKKVKKEKKKKGDSKKKTTDLGRGNKSVKKVKKEKKKKSKSKPKKKAKKGSQKK